MPVNPTYPGVYVQEIPSGVRTIAGVSTSVALFVGRTARGPLNKPIVCLNYGDFERQFSGDTANGEMAHQAKLFFTNGGTQCYVLRIANGALSSSVALQTAAGANSLTLTAKNAGRQGDMIRALVTYGGRQPEATFSLALYRVSTNAAGVEEQLEAENLQNLSMDPDSPTYAPDFVTQHSALVTAELHAASPGVTNPGGFSQSGLPVTHQAASAASFQMAWQVRIGTAAPANAFMISIDGSPYMEVDLSAIDVAGLAGPSLTDFQDQLAAAILSAVEDAFTAANLPGTTLSVAFAAGPAPGANEAPDDASTLLRFTSQNDGDIFIRPAARSDLAAALRLGSAQGGLEVSAFAEARPAPTGISMQMADPAIWNAFASLTQGALTQITLPAVDASGAATTVNIPLDLITSAADDPMYLGGGVAQKLALMRDAINAFQQANRRTFFWRAALAGYRLCLSRAQGDDNTIAAIAMAPTDFPTTVAGSFLRNVRRYRLGHGGTAGTQTPGVAGNDGAAPRVGDYDEAYVIARREVDLFNLLILPQDAEPAQPMTDLYPAASAFCQQRRAFLLMDPPADWRSAQTAAEHVDDLRLGLTNDHAAIFYPNLTINAGGLRKHVGPSGAMAGLMARIDSARGVWKAPAGTEATLRGVIGLQYQFSDAENGLMNPRAVNTIRVFPNGIVSWGARTMDGDNDFGSEYKYIPVRRLALYIEESLYRGLKWVVFEPNDEPLWSQIRLNTGAFMHGLFRQRAFQGATPKEAYFVKCDRETTTQADRNLGIVNVVVGFAPLKPAEFVIISIQQMAGQIEAG